MSSFGRLIIAAGTKEKESKVEVTADLKGLAVGNSWLRIEANGEMANITVGAQSKDSYRAPWPVDEKSILRQGEVTFESSLVLETVNHLLLKRDFSLDEVSAARLQASLSTAIYRMKKRNSEKEQ